MQSANEEVNKTRTTSDSTVHALSQELRYLKQDLEKVESREKQVSFLKHKFLFRFI